MAISFKSIFAFSLFTLLFFISATNITYATCGNIIYHQAEGSSSVTETVPITDCANPFNSIHPVHFDYKLTLADQVITEGVEIVVPENSLVEGQFILDTINNTTLYPLQLFIRDGQDYRQVEAIQDNQFVTTQPLVEGEYTAVFTHEDAPLFTQYQEPTWPQRLKELFTINTVYAIAPAPFSSQVATINFSVKYAKDDTPKPTSVLFLPGIMGSRLYEANSAECASAKGEQERWFSSDDCDQLRLQTNFLGKSVNDLYTKDSQTAIVDEAYTQNLYKTFLSSLQSWKDDNLIADYTAVPYDWRLSLSDNLESKVDKDGHVKYESGTELKDSYLYQTLAKLASTSQDGKVTIVAHSNGGLLAKYLLSVLEHNQDPLLQKINKLILVAVPQIGTPEAAVGILHGTELDFVMSQQVSRQLMNQMAFAYHLLPTPTYFKSVRTPLIHIDQGEVTDSMIEQFGADINSQASLFKFLDKNSGRAKPQDEDLLTPQTVDPALLNYARTEATRQAGWQPPSYLKVYQVAGTGLETISSLTYFTDQKCVKRSWFRCVKYAPKLGYRVRMAIDGDGTVVVPSALALASSSAEQWWVNLKEFNKFNFNKKHRSILEVSELEDLVGKLVTAKKNFNYQYLSTSTPTISGGVRLTFQLHSPLDMYLVTTAGSVLSSTSQAVSGGTYRRFGELQYISVPASTEATLHLVGQADGSFTLDVAKVDHNGELIKRHTFSALPTTQTTKAELTIKQSLDNPDSLLDLSLDYNGDGVTDVIYDETGNWTVGEDSFYKNVYRIIETLPLKDKPKQHLVKLVKKLKKLEDKVSKKHQHKHHKLLKRLKKKLLHKLDKLERKERLSEEEAEQLEAEVKSLIKSFK